MIVSEGVDVSWKVDEQREAYLEEEEAEEEKFSGPGSNGCDIVMCNCQSNQWRALSDCQSR
jgi:hypothetical protein